MPAREMIPKLCLGPNLGPVSISKSVVFGLCLRSPNDPDASTLPRQSLGLREDINNRIDDGQEMNFSSYRPAVNWVWDQMIEFELSYI